jgi:hypothetical protein
MNIKHIVILIVVATLTGISGYLVGTSSISSITPTITPQPTPITQITPTLIAPAHGAEFVDSDVILNWSWQPNLSDTQRFVMRIWAEDKPLQEIWTVDNSLDVNEQIDSFSVEVGTFFWQVAVVNTDIGGGFESMGSDWSETFELQRVRRLSIPAKEYADMSPAAQYFHDQNLNISDTIDAVHRFIQTNSILDQQKTYDADYSDAIDLMFNYAQGNTTDQPFLQCDGRSTAMLTTLRELGIESRLVFLYRPVPGYLSQHTTLDVFNPQTQSWELHDLNWDFYFVEADSLKRVSAERVLFGSRETLLGCPMEGGDCTAGIMEESASYFNALRYGYTFELWVNPDRFELSTRFEGQDNKNLVEFVSGDDPQRVTFRMDSWDVTDNSG